MPQPVDARLERMLRASEAAGKVVVAARIEGTAIELTYEGNKRQDDADLIDWKPRRK